MRYKELKNIMDKKSNKKKVFDEGNPRIILVDARTMGSRPSGIGIYLFHFLMEMRKREDLLFHLVTDVAESEEIKALNRAGVPVEVYGTPCFRSASVYKYFRFVNRKIKEVDPDIFWEPNNLMPMRPASFQGQVMLTVHDIFPITEPSFYNRIYRMYFRYNLRRSIRYSQILLYDSRETRDAVWKFVKDAADKKHTITYVIIEKLRRRFVKPIEDGDNSLHGEEDAPEQHYFLYVGNMEKRKGVDLLLKAFVQYVNEGGTKYLKIAGKMRGEDSIKELLDQAMEKTQRIEYLGYVTEEEKADLFENCDCFVFPSRAEGFGMPVIEAMQYDKSAIVSDLGIFKETLEDSVNYFALGENEEEEIRNLTSAMHEHRIADVETYKGILSKFDGEACVTRLMAVLEG